MDHLQDRQEPSPGYDSSIPKLITPTDLNETSCRVTGVEETVIKVNEIVRKLANSELDEEVQVQLGRLRSFIAGFESGLMTVDYAESLLVAATALSAAKANILLAQGILWDLEFYLLYSGKGAGRLLARLTGGWPMVTAGMGMLAAAIVFLIIWAIFRTLNHFNGLPSFMWSGGPELMTAMLFGVVGGSLSILTRIQKPIDLQKLNPISLFLNCLFKPLVGAVFAGIIYCMLETNLFGGILKTGFVGDKEYLYILLVGVIGFISGFSERFAADAIGSVESTLIKRNSK